jgi:hypothetical protein
MAGFFCEMAHMSGKRDALARSGLTRAAAERLNDAAPLRALGLPDLDAFAKNCWCRKQDSNL